MENNPNLTSFKWEILYKNSKFYKLKFTNKELPKIPLETPECQRVLDNSHVNDIIEFQNKHKQNSGDFFFPNAITFAELNGKLYVIDGQHRLTSIGILSRQHPTHAFDLFCDVYIIANENELDRKYQALNENKKVCLPDDFEVYKNFSKKIEEYIHSNYRVYFSNSERPNIPHFKMEKLSMKLNDSNLDIVGRSRNDYTLFIDEMEKLNLFYQRCYSNDNVSRYFSNNIEKYIKKCLDKQPGKSWVLGIYKQFEWVERVLYKIETGTEYEQMEHIHIGTRTKIRKPLRRSVWEKHSKSMEGKCYVCDKQIDYDTFECGHIEAVFYGGKTNIKNLVPICSSCNRDMGIQNLESYKTEYRKAYEL